MKADPILVGGSVFIGNSVVSTTIRSGLGSIKQSQDATLTLMTKDEELRSALYERDSDHSTIPISLLRSQMGKL